MRIDPASGLDVVVATICVLFLFVGRALGEEDPPTVALEAAAWTRLAERLGSVGLDGTLQREYPLHDDTLLRELGFDCVLRHMLVLDGRGKARSTWRIPALHSQLVPDGRDHLRWQSPDGMSVRFERKKIARTLSVAGAPAPWRIRKLPNGDHEIRADDGRWWRYHRGALQSFGHPLRGEFLVSARGGLIETIWSRNDSAPEDPYLYVQYDESGQPALFVLGGCRHLFEWNDDGELMGWTDGKGTTVNFSYRSGLLCGISGPGSADESFRWGENRGWEHGDSRWPAPVHLRSDGVRIYRCTLSQAGLSIHVRRMPGGDGSTTIFNPQRETVEQISGDEHLKVWFTRAGNRKRLERVERADGKLLEQYEYDSQGRLERVERLGAVPITLTYDALGRSIQTNHSERELQQ